MLLRCLLVFAFLLIQSFAVTKVSKKQTLLTLSHKQSEPIVMGLTKRERTFAEQKKLVSFLQSTKAQLNSEAFLQTDYQMLGGSNKHAFSFKYTHAHSHKHRSLTPRNVELPLENYVNTQYTGNVGVGAEDNLFKVVLDTGSTAFFLNSDLCEDYACTSHNMYVTKESKTLILTTPALGLEVVYGSGVLNGILATDDVYFGNMKIPKAALFLVNRQQGIFNHANFEGVLGLGKSETSDIEGQQVTSLFDLIRTYLPQPYFSFNLKRNDEPGSYIMFGGYNMNDIASEIVWHNVVNDRYWMIELSNVFIGDEAINLCKYSKCGAVIDSGTSILTAPTKGLIEMDSLMDKTGGCDNLELYPNINFELGNTKYELTPNEYTITVNQDDEVEFYTHSKPVKECTGIFSPMNLVTPDGRIVFILGDTFLTKYYAIFDAERNRIGLALQKRV